MRRFGRYKGHVAIDPDSEIITAVEVTAGNVGDGSVAKILLADVLPSASRLPRCRTSRSHLSPQAPVEVFRDASYGTADVVETLEQAGIEPNVKVQPPSARESPLRKYG